jgi:ADP-ribose pyrophosphatase
MKRDDVALEGRETLLDGFIHIDRLHLRHRLFAGGWTGTLQREVMLRGAVAAVLPYDPARDRLVLIEQFRIGPFAAKDPEPWLIEIVAGMVEPGESVAEMARRKTLEETGCTVGRLEKIMDFYSSPGGSSQQVALFCAEIASDSAGGLHGLAEEGEDIRVFTKSVDEALAMVRSGIIRNAISIVGVQWLALNRDALRRRWA